jgi:Domain of unknown function (DUF4272)
MIESNVPEEYEPPTAARVAARAQVLSAQAFRATLERSASDPEVAEAHVACISWCERVGLHSEFEPHEWALLTTPVGQLSQRDAVNASWLTEAAVCLAWALCQAEVPDYEIEADGATVSMSVHFLDDTADAFRAQSELKPQAELKDLLDLYLTLHWRLREFSLRPRHLDFVTFAAQCEWAKMRLDQVRIVHNDLSVGGGPLVAAPENLWRACLSIASERHRAAEWLLGQHPVYSEATSDT